LSIAQNRATFEASIWMKGPVMSTQSALPGSATVAEVNSQPAVWRRSLELLPHAVRVLAAPGEKALLLGCGTSAFVAHALAELRERAGLGETHWSYASEPPHGRRYDRVVALTRSGTTTEVLDALRDLPVVTRRFSVCAAPGMPVDELVEDGLVLDFADESSVVQTRFPTTTILLAREAFATAAGTPPVAGALITAAEQVLASPSHLDPARFGQFVFLARGWAIGLAAEAALKIRESAQAWSESYPALDYRHGPIATATPDSLVWILGTPPAGLIEQIEATGATVVATGQDPLVDLVALHRLSLELAASKGLDPDTPRNLQRSVILPAR
jgi:glutamine---fructose-6-phosphate transaminase (isomerizing)